MGMEGVNVSEPAYFVYRCISELVPWAIALPELFYSYFFRYNYVFYGINTEGNMVYHQDTAILKSFISI